jgi:hypothetical protein
MTGGPGARYLGAGFALGLLWFAVLLVPAMTREFMRGLGLVVSAALLCLVSASLAWLLRRPIASGERDWALAVGAPLLGAALFGVAAAVAIWVRNGFRALSYRDLALVPVWAMIAALALWFVVVPVGYLCQRVMRAVAERGG